MNMRDQADGLRQLFHRQGVRVLPVFGSPERVALCINLCAALAADGLKAVLLDASRGEAHEWLGLKARYELKHLLMGEKRIDEVALSARAGYRVVPAYRGAQMLAEVGGQGEKVFGGFASLSDPADIVVLNASQSLAGRLLPAGDGEVLVSTTSAPEAITAAYASIKTLAAHHGRGRFRLVVFKAGPAEAQQIHERIAALGSQRLGVTVEFGGAVPADVQLLQAERSHTDILAVDRSGGAAMAFRSLAASLADWPLARCGTEESVGSTTPHHLA